MSTIPKVFLDNPSNRFAKCSTPFPQHHVITYATDGATSARHTLFAGKPTRSSPSNTRAASDHDRTSSTDAFGGATPPTSRGLDRVAIAAVAPALVSNRRRLAALAVPRASLATRATAIDPTIPAHVTIASTTTNVRRRVVILRPRVSRGGVDADESNRIDRINQSQMKMSNRTRPRGAFRAPT